MLLNPERQQNGTESKYYETFSKYITRKINILFDKKKFHFCYNLFLKQILKRKFTNTQEKAELLCKEKTFDFTSLSEQILVFEKIKC